MKFAGLILSRQEVGKFAKHAQVFDDNYRGRRVKIVDVKHTSLIVSNDVANANLNRLQVMPLTSN